MQTRMVREILALLLSVALATPTSAFALNPKYDKPKAATPDETEVVALFEPVQTADGRQAYLALASIDADKEQKVVTELAQNANHPTFFLTSGPSDPVAQIATSIMADSAANSGSFGNLSVTYTSEDMPLLRRKGVSSAVRDRIQTKIEEISERFRESKAGLIGALVYSTAMSGLSTYYFSAGIGTGLQTFAVLFLAYAVIALEPEKWGKLLDLPGSLATKVLTMVFGELGETTKHVLHVAGATAATWAFNSAMVAFTFYMSNQLQSFSQVAYFGFLGSYGVIDSSVLRRAQEGKISNKNVDRYYAFQFVVGTILEVLGIANFGYIQSVLATMTSMGIFYMLIDDKNGQRLIVPKMKTFRGRLRFPKFESVGRLVMKPFQVPLKFTSVAVKSNGKLALAECETRLVAAAATKGRRPPPVQRTNREIAEDLQ